MVEIKDYSPYLDHPKQYNPQTNADRIRSMSDEELALELRHLMIYPLKGKILDWIRQPVKDGENDGR